MGERDQEAERSGKGPFSFLSPVAGKRGQEEGCSMTTLPISLSPVAGERGG
jgi:hypothetical protein